MRIVLTEDQMLPNKRSPNQMVRNSIVSAKSEYSIIRDFLFRLFLFAFIMLV